MRAGKVDYAAAILDFSIDGSSRRALVDKTGITSVLLEEYLDLLVSKDLVRLVHDKNGKHESIKTTDRGVRFLELYQSIKARYLTTDAK